MASTLGGMSVPSNVHARDTSGMDCDGDVTGFRVEDWWMFHELSGGGREERLELEGGSSPTAAAARTAFDHVQDVIDAGGVEALALIVELLGAGPDPEGAVTVGAGPLEDLVCEHGAELIDEVERLTRTDPAFTRALESVWLESGVLPAVVEARLARWVRITGADMTT
jgi:hypothetical protein